jgi:acyl-coenzyme A thioesterase PaaI-like protein
MGAPEQPKTAGIPKNMDRWLGDGGMPIIAALGGAFDAYRAEGDGWVSGTWVPTSLACNPHGIVQAGVHSVVLDAAMNFAINAGLTGKDRTRATLEMKTEIMRVANAGDQLTVRGEVSRQAKLVAYAEAQVRTGDGSLVSRSTGTFLLHRQAEE